MQPRDVTKRDCGRRRGIEAVLFGLLLFTPIAGFGKSHGEPKTVVDADLTITAATNPYILNGALAVSGGGRKTITLSPGVDIESGKIELGNRGTLLIQGTKTAPVILRNISISQDLGGSVKAEFAVFDHCSFWKSGGWFASYSSKWELTSSLLYQCVFPRLTAVDYGFKFNRCTFVSMKFPEIGSRRSKDHPFDHMKALRQEWRTIADCKFVDCQIPPTVFWCSQFGDYIKCRFASGEPFESDTKTVLLAWIGDTVGPSPEEAWAQNPAVRAPVSVQLRAAPFDSADPSPVCPIDAISGDADLVSEIWHTGAQTAQAAQPAASAPATPAMAEAAALKPAPATPSASSTPSQPSILNALSEQAPNASAWVLAPLDETVPADIRQNLTMLREDLLDEAKAAPRAGPAAYTLGRQLCDGLISVLDERDATLVHYGYRVAQVQANTQVTSMQLEANRNHQMSWPQYRREKDQAAEIFRQQMNAARVEEELPKVDWSNRCAVLRRALDGLYAEYRESLRDSH